MDGAGVLDVELLKAHHPLPCESRLLQDSCAPIDETVLHLKVQLVKTQDLVMANAVGTLSWPHSPFHKTRIDSHLIRRKSRLARSNMQMEEKVDVLEPQILVAIRVGTRWS